MPNAFITPKSNEPLAFFKMAGAGNDFVVIDNRAGRVVDPSELTRRICTRRLSVGADGLILIETSARATFRMRYFNQDGGLADFCANGTRCAARFAFVNVIAPKRMTIETDAGVVGAEVADGGAVTLSLPPPRAFAAERPLRVGDRTIRGSSILVAVLTRSGITLEVSFALDGGELSDVRLKGDARLIYRATMTPETIEGFDPDFARDPAAKVLSAEC